MSTNIIVSKLNLFNDNEINLVSLFILDKHYLYIDA